MKEFKFNKYVSQVIPRKCQPTEFMKLEYTHKSIITTCGGTSLLGGLALSLARNVLPNISSCLPKNRRLLNKPLSKLVIRNLIRDRYFSASTHRRGDHHQIELQNRRYMHDPKKVNPFNFRSYNQWYWQSKSDSHTSPEIPGLLAILANVLVVGAKDLRPDAGGPGPEPCNLEPSQLHPECGVLDRVHETEALPLLRDGNLEVPPLEEHSCTPIEVIPTRTPLPKAIKKRRFIQLVGLDSKGAWVRPYPLWGVRRVRSAGVGT